MTHIRPRDDAVISVGHTGSLQVIGPPSFITIQTLTNLNLTILNFTIVSNTEITANNRLLTTKMGKFS